MPTKFRRTAAELMPERKTTSEVVFQDLYRQIVSLDLMPGSKMSETEVADRFGVSRQPVRDAFNLLSNMGFLLIQPQKATEIRRFSLADITEARFVRLAVELEVIRSACTLWSDNFRELFDKNLAEQEACVAEGDPEKFHELDGAFHELISEVAQKPFAYRTILQNRLKVHRICLLSMRQEQEMAELLSDHRALYAAIADGDAERAEATLRAHLRRIEATIHSVWETRQELFES